MERDQKTSEVAKRKRRSSEEVRDRVIAAAGVEFGRHGYSGTTTAAIARRAEVTEAQIFRCFTSKGDLFRRAIFEPLNRHFADFQARQREIASDAVAYREGARRYIAELQEFIGEHSGMLLSLLVAKAYAQDPTEGGAGLQGLREYFDRGAAMMRRRSSGEHKVAPELIVRVSFAAILGCVLFNDWMFAPGVADDEAIREATLDFVLDGLNAGHDYV